MSYKHILVAVDLSKSSEVVINKAISLARDANSKLSFICVDVNSVSSRGGVSTKVEMDMPLDEQQAILQKELQELAEQADYPVANTLVVIGDLNEKLKATVQEMEVDLLVCGHHHDFWSRILSSARKLVNTAVTDLLIIYLEK
ncbi:MAG: universal stress protein A [Psychromonas sp.]|jgi:universal stress protein A|uniref:universal stress protein n=1 Tax=Psychromonas sp. TaxID=1884585 RepID=UPI0039E68D24